MSRLKFTAEMFDNRCEMKLSNSKACKIAQAIYDKHVEGLPKVYFNEPGFEMAMDKNSLGTDRVWVQSNKPHGDTHTARLEAMEERK